MCSKIRKIKNSEKSRGYRQCLFSSYEMLPISKSESYFNSFLFVNNIYFYVKALAGSQDIHHSLLAIFCARPNLSFT
jgi:hypothetical protein